MSTDEVQCMVTIAEALERSLYGTPQKEDECLELLDLLINLLVCDQNPRRLHQLIFQSNPQIIPILIAFIQSNYLRDTPLVVLSVQVISRIVALCSHEHRPSSGNNPVVTSTVSEQVYGSSTSPIRDELVAILSKTCGERLLNAQLGPLLQSALIHQQTPEAVRLVVVECIFILIMRNEFLRKEMVAQLAYVPMLLNVLSRTAEGASPNITSSTQMVRNYACACLRELCNSPPIIPVLAECNSVQILLEVIRSHDGLGVTTDILILSLEIIQAVAPCFPACVLHTPYQQEIVNTLRDILDVHTSRAIGSTRGSAEIVEATANLLFSLIALAHKLGDCLFFSHASEALLNRLLAHALRVPNARVQATIARALRMFVQCCPPQLCMGHRTLTHYASLSHFLNILTNSLPPAQPDVEILQVETSLLIAICLCQNPNTRRYVSREVSKTFPTLAQQIFNTLVRSITSSHATPIQLDITLLDITGFVMNDPNTVNWEATDASEGATLSMEQIREVFAKQHSRVSLSNHDYNGAPTNLPTVFAGLPSDAMETVSKSVYLTQHLLLHAAYLTFSPEGSKGEVNQVKRVSNIYSPRNDHIGRSITQFNIGSSITPSTNGMATRSRSAGTNKPLSGTMNTSTAASPTPRQRLNFDSPRRQNSTKQTSPLGTTEQSPAAQMYEAAFQLATSLSKHYAGNMKRKKPVYVPTGDGFVIRQTVYKNPWNKVIPTQQKQYWYASDLLEGDLFFFRIPYGELSIVTLENVIAKASIHQTNAKKLFMTTPQVARGRRWFLYDMTNEIMPGIIQILQRLLENVRTYGEDNVRFPLYWYREDAINAGERCIHCGNVLEIVQQIESYFNEKLNSEIDKK